MSRGPGYVQQAIVQASEADPTSVFTASDLMAIAYPGTAPSLKHRIVVIRAARQLACDPARFERYVGPPGTEGMILTNATDVRSLSVGRVYARYRGAKTIDECKAMLDDPLSEAFLEAQRDGYFDLIARSNALWVLGRDDEATALDDVINARIDQANRERQAKAGARQITETAA